MIKSVYFSSEELKCKCGTPECDAKEMDPRFLLRADRIRHRMGRPLQVTSARRCSKHNMIVGGSPRSQHLKGKAMDLIIGFEEHSKFLQICREEGITGIGRATTWCHIDDREGELRTWTN